MKFTPNKLNLFMLFKLPSAYFCGLRVRSVNENRCEVCVRYSWFNKNPFKSMYFAVQAMAAEFTTGVLVMQEIKKRNANISMLVASNKAVFLKKATGKICFYCVDGPLIKDFIASVIETKEAKTIWLTAIGINEDGDKIAEMQFEWTLKLRT